MTAHQDTLSEFHWLLEVLQTIDVGMLVVDLEFNVAAWNGFMENHSGIAPQDALGRNLFDVFTDIPRDWFEHKSRTVIQLQNRAFTTWEQRPYVFKFKNNRPITGTAEFMYQNCTFIPVSNIRGQVESLCIIVYDVTDVAVSKMELQKANQQLKHLSRTDRLTSLFNRGYWEELLEAEFRRQQRSNRHTSLVLFDIDHFKPFNDTYGHTVGDDVIRMVADVTRDTIRNTDLAGRYGGEEFGIILPDTPPQEAVQLAERLRERIEEMIVDSHDQKLQVTISLGVAGYDSDLNNHNQWIDKADQALYLSKETGRNRVSLA